MRHAILGAGGVGGLMAATLRHAGEEVLLLVRPEQVDRHPEQLHLESCLGSFDVAVGVAARLEDADAVDVVWLAVKATQLEDALPALGEGAPRFRAMVPLLNGVDHVARLRSRYGRERVIPAAIRVESERVAPGRIVHRSPFVRLTVAESGRALLQPALDKLAALGFACEFSPDEATLLWSKVIFLAPLALATSAADLSIGGLMRDPAWHQRVHALVEESAAVAAAEGATVDAAGTLKFMEGLPGEMRSSMQKDVAAGRPPELDAIGGPILRGGLQYGIPTPITREMVEQIVGKLDDARAARPSSSQ